MERLKASTNHVILGIDDFTGYLLGLLRFLLLGHSGNRRRFTRLLGLGSLLNATWSCVVSLDLYLSPGNVGLAYLAIFNEIPFGDAEL